MKKFSKIVLVTFIAMIIGGCGLFKKTPKPAENVYGTEMVNSYVMAATQWQIDSICTADNLPNLDEWAASSFTDFETGKVTVKRMYIKYEGKTELMYIVTGYEEPYGVSRRIRR